ncbi:MAG: HAD family hydrolase [Ruminococcaceae bacterium]|nr:HAD family hydrolase [Oscillospiraceae bacterium]
MKYNTVLFDLDGTLTDPGEGITNSVIHSLKYFGIEEKDRVKLYKFIGPPLWESFEVFYGFSREKAVEAVEHYREYYKVKGIYENYLYEGVKEMLESLKSAGIKILVATSKPEKFANIILEHFGIAKYFDFIGGASMDGKRVNKDDVIAYTLKSAEVSDVSKCVMVGDRLHDILGAKALDMDSIGVLYGYGDYKELSEAGATYIAENPEKAVEIILR